ncbi:MAG: protein translocase subunit SecDF [Flavobacteriales bacterium]|nr:protein translocase subunit SecDF [Flavobacteriales bacterium]
MQNRNLVSLFAILFALVCLYQLSFTWIANGIEDNARLYANGDEVKERAYLDSIATEPVYNIGLKEYTYNECTAREINLGLDLKGGMNVTLEVSVKDVIRAMSNYSKDETFNAAIASATAQQRNSQDDFVTLFGSVFEEIDPNAKLASIFYTPELKDLIQTSSSNQEVINVIREEVEEAINRSFNVLRTRIDRFGVTQPNIQRLEGSGRILIELPGVKDPERVRRLLQGTAQLEFWETFENAEVLAPFSEVNAFLKSTIDNDTEEQAEEVVKDETASFSEKASSLDSLTSIIDTAALSADQFALENPFYAVLIPNINQNNQPNQGPVCGFAAVKDTAQINTYLLMPEVQDLLPRDLKLAWTVKPYDTEGNFVQLIALKVTSRDGKAAMAGDVVTDARTEFGQFNGSPEVSMSMSAEGGRAWKRLTGENIGKSVAIVLDNYVYSFPTVQAEIYGGRSQITGNFSINEADDLANILKSGKLPAPARIIEEAIVGPSLGQEAIDAGFRSFIIALMIVLGYMIFYYNFAGVVSNTALLANLFFVFGVLSSIGGVLTLPGIAGIVLTIGMSVDANVLIYERVREELMNGKGLRLAVADGYKAAYSSIIDANVTTLLTGIILYVFGTGPIKGFATTLVIGILTSLFSAIFITRLMFYWRLSKKESVSFDNKITRGAFKNTAVDFIGKRKRFYIFSSLIILLGIGSFISKGLNYGVDFKGGRTFVVRFDDTANNEDLRASLGQAFVTGGVEMFPEVKTFGEDNQVKITTKYLIDNQDLNADELVTAQLAEGLAAYGAYEIMSSQKVGPTIADDIKDAAVWSVVFSLLVIFLYILLRFRKWQFSLGAVAAVFHDVMIVLSIFSIFYGILPFSLEIDQAFIAAILTIIGYSLNDTVVVFDRIREHMGIFKKKDFNELVNNALNSTLSRTINTSITTFFVLLIIFLFGGEVIRGFMFALMVGVLVGTYSSLFVASPIMLDTINKYENKKKK